MLGFFSADGPVNRIRERIARDDDTRQRLRHGIWYKSPDWQEGAHVRVDGRDMIMLASNDYLGLGHHPKVVAAAKAALDKWGAGTTGARLANGSRAYHGELEERIAAFLGKEACHATSAGYLSCMSAPATFATRGDLILVDRNVHSSLWAGVQASGARFERFAHNDAADLDTILKAESRDVPKIVVVEGVYSMEGHICALPAIVEVAKKHGAFIILDDAHGFGVLGEAGRGTAAHFGLTQDVDIICGSLSKSLSSTGGYVAGSKAAIEYLRTHSKQTIFSAALAPSQAAAAQAALEVMQDEPVHIERLWANTRAHKEVLDSLGADTWGSQTPAVPIVLGERMKAYDVWKRLWEAGLFTVLAIAPAVPPGRDLVRTAISARLTQEDMEKVGAILKRTLAR
jgi:8-amino-7-oxononanoate synthase